MAQLTERENYLMCLRGQQPEWIPHMGMGGPKRISPTGMASPSFLMKHMMPNSDHIDIWGVEYVTSPEAAGAYLPKTWDFILDDITKWHDVIKAPDLSGIDWEQMAKKDLERFKPDRVNQATSYGAGGVGFFQHLMSFMGFTEGLCALFEEPEECQALFEYLGDFYCEVCEKSIDYYKPDVLGIVDDTAAWGNPFVSLDMFREFLVPQYKRLAQFAHDRDLVITYHNCGKCESFIDDMVNVVGINEWNPAQNCNDLAAIKAKYGNKLTLCGCINSSQTFIGEMTDEHIREIVWDVANKYAPGGGFQFMVTFIIPDRENNPEMVRREYFVNEVMEEVSHEFYKK